MISSLHNQAIFALCQSLGPCTIAYNPCTQFQKQGSITTALCDKTKILTKTEIKTFFLKPNVWKQTIGKSLETEKF